MEYIDFSAAYPDAAEDSGESNDQPAPYSTQALSEPVQDQSKADSLYVNASQHVSCDIKPRLTKEQHDILENHYIKQSKPNTNTKKGFAEALNVTLDKVNVSSQ